MAGVACWTRETPERACRAPPAHAGLPDTPQRPSLAIRLCERPYTK